MKFLEGKKSIIASVVLVTAASAAVLLPLFVIAFFGYPSADDFSFVAPVYRAHLNGEGFFGLLKASFDNAVWYYKNWQGRYTDNLVYSLGWGTAFPKLYFLGAWIMLISFFAVSIFTVTCFLKDFFKLSKARAYVCASIFTLMQILYLPYPSQGFYWYTGASSYTLTYTFLFLLGYLVWRIGRDGGKPRYVAAAAFCILFVAGSNYSTALLGIEIMVLVLALKLFMHGKWKIHLALTAEYLILFGVNALAPSNGMRLGAVEIMSPPDAVIASFKQSPVFIREWMHIPVFLMLLAILWLVLPYLGNGGKYRLPLLYTIVTFCLFTSIITPPFYAGSTWGPGRLINTMYFAYYFMLCSNMIYWAGWIKTKILDKKSTSVQSEKGVFSDGYMLVVLAVFGVCMMGCLKYYSLMSTSSTGALMSLVKGEAAVFKAENEARWALYEDPDLTAVTVPDYSVKPHILYQDDISDDRTDWRNTSVASFFGKEWVELEH